MNPLVFAILVVVATALLVWAVDSSHLAEPPKSILKVVLILIAALIIAHTAGLL